MGELIKGRGSTGYLPGRFEVTVSEAVDDGWQEGEPAEFAAVLPRTRVREEIARSIITRNKSSDIGFSQSVNPYRGCEHGCSYCFARPSHARACNSCAAPCRAPRRVQRFSLRAAAAPPRAIFWSATSRR